MSCYSLWGAKGVNGLAVAVQAIAVQVVRHSRSSCLRRRRGLDSTPWVRTRSPQAAALLIAASVAAAPATVLAGAPLSFAAGAITTDYAIGVALADFNRDGKLDLVTASCPDVKLRLGDGMGAFGAPASSATPDAGQCRLAVGDLNADGFSDIAVVFGFASPSFPGRVAVFFSDGAGGLVDVPSYPSRTIQVASPSPI